MTAQRAATNPRHPDTGNVESHFRERVRDILNLDWSTRDETLFAELRRLKAISGERRNKEQKALDDAAAAVR